MALVDVDSGRLQRWFYGPGVLAEEHLVVPKAGRSGGIWIVGTALDVPRQRMLLSVPGNSAIRKGLNKKPPHSVSAPPT